MDSGIGDNKSSDDNTCRNRSRSKNINPADKLLLFEIIQKSQYENILNNKKNSRSINQNKINTWVKIVDEFNAIASVRRSAVQLKGVYRNEMTTFRKTLVDAAPSNLTSEETSSVTILTGSDAFLPLKSNLNPLLPRFVQEANKPVNNICCTDDFFQDSYFKNDEGTVMNNVLYPSFATSRSSTVSAISSDRFHTPIQQQDHDYIKTNMSAHIIKPRFVKCNRVKTSNVAKREMYKSYAKAAAERSKREEKESAKKIELMNEKILYYRKMRENLQLE